jgi:hypothetical protein
MMILSVVVTVIVYNRPMNVPMGVLFTQEQHSPDHEDRQRNNHQDIRDFSQEQNRQQGAYKRGCPKKCACPGCTETPHRQDEEGDADSIAETPQKHGDKGDRRFWEWASNNNRENEGETPGRDSLDSDNG